MNRIGPILFFHRCRRAPDQIHACRQLRRKPRQHERAAASFDLRIAGFDDRLVGLFLSGLKQTAARHGIRPLRRRRHEANADRDKCDQRGGLAEERVPHPFRRNRVGPVVDARMMDGFGNDLTLQHIPASRLHVGTLLERRKEPRVEFGKGALDVPRNVGPRERQRLGPDPQDRGRQPRRTNDPTEREAKRPTNSPPDQRQRGEADPAPRQLPPQPQASQTLTDERHLVAKLLLQHDGSPGEGHYFAQRPRESRLTRQVGVTSHSSRAGEEISLARSKNTRAPDGRHARVARWRNLK